MKPYYSYFEPEEDDVEVVEGSQPLSAYRPHKSLSRFYSMVTGLVAHTSMINHQYVLLSKIFLSCRNLLIFVELFDSIIYNNIQKSEVMSK